MNVFETLGDYLEKHNPFALINGKNEMLFFKNYEEAYLYTLKDLRKYCKKGYVDLPLLVKHLTDFDDDTCMEVAEYMTQSYKEWRDKPVLIDWSRVGYEKEKLIAILKGLHGLTETEYDWLEFECAWNRFTSWNEDFENEEKTNEKELRKKDYF